jgi:hypothetical protein
LKYLVISFDTLTVKLTTDGDLSYWFGASKESLGLLFTWTFGLLAGKDLSTLELGGSVILINY